MKNNIRKIVFGVFSIFILGMYISCSEENILDLKPYNQVDEDVAFSSVENIEKSVNGVYNIAQKGFFERSGRNLFRGYPFGGAYFQQNDCRGEDMVNVSSFYRYTYNSTYNPNTDNNGNYWASLYKLINECNLVIQGVNKAVGNNIVSAEKAKTYLGQVLFFRAYSHLELLKHFARPYNDNPTALRGGVPYLTNASTDSKSAIKNSRTNRGTVKENYAQILKDLDEAETLLSTSKKTILRVTKNTAIALKTRVYLNMNEWAKVITEANKLNGEYKLTAKPDEPFTSPRNNTESIFSLDNSATNNPGVNGALSSQYNKRKLIAISPIIWNSTYWKGDDKRRTSLTRDSKGVKYINKYTDTQNNSDPSPLFRYAEVLLNRAEAKMRLGQMDFINDLNTVRERSSTKYQASDFTTDVERLSAIVFERRIEYLGEGMRWGDIHRLQNDILPGYNGIPAKHLNGRPKPASYTIGTGYTFNAKDIKAIPYSDFRFLWPLPTSEVSVNDVLKQQQNPGW